MKSSSLLNSSEATDSTCYDPEIVDELCLGYTVEWNNNNNNDDDDASAISKVSAGSGYYYPPPQELLVCHHHHNSTSDASLGGALGAAVLDFDQVTTQAYHICILDRRHRAGDTLWFRVFCCNNNNGKLFAELEDEEIFGLVQAVLEREAPQPVVFYVHRQRDDTTITPPVMFGGTRIARVLREIMRCSYVQSDIVIPPSAAKKKSVWKPKWWSRWRSRHKRKKAQKN